MLSCNVCVRDVKKKIMIISASDASIASVIKIIFNMQKLCTGVCMCRRLLTCLYLCFEQIKETRERCLAKTSVTDN